MKLYIKNMVCDRCIHAVKNELEKAGLHPIAVNLGEAELPERPGTESMLLLEKALRNLGFELMDDRKSRLIEKIKNIIIRLVHHSGDLSLDANLSTLLAGELHYEYHYLSSLFSDVEGIAIEKYFIKQKIERAKELLVYDELTVSQIANSLGYSSVAHFSNQFKQVTGLTPSHYKNIRANRKPLDKL